MRLTQAFSPRWAALAASLFVSTALPASAGTVKITPLGSHDGELCRFDRAPIPEDPDGTRLLYDAGRTVAGPEDPRLGKTDPAHVWMLRSMAATSGWGVGSRWIETCAQPDLAALPVSFCESDARKIDLSTRQERSLLVALPQAQKSWSFPKSRITEQALPETAT